MGMSHLKVKRTSDQ